MVYSHINFVFQILINFFLVLQVYKFCECKNGIHKISPDGNKFSYKVDCNIKQVFPDTEQRSDIETSTSTSKIPKITENVEENKNTIWSIFGINSASPVANNAVMPNLVCMFVYLVLTLFN